MRVAWHAASEAQPLFALSLAPLQPAQLGAPQAGRLDDIVGGYFYPVAFLSSRECCGPRVLERGQLSDPFPGTSLPPGWGWGRLGMISAG